ncbi:hypothetical protein J6590_073679 [Homalodisca vitripennis]|nr:hypothetical protein J6590_073679 [Homalodisca vitripennis]
MLECKGPMFSRKPVLHSINHSAPSPSPRSGKQARTRKNGAKLIDSPLPRNFPGSVAVADFRTTTGHDYLGKYLHRIGKMQIRAVRFADIPDEEDGYREIARHYWSERH